jgi:hypothetical protein
VLRFRTTAIHLAAAAGLVLASLSVAAAPSASASTATCAGHSTQDTVAVNSDIAHLRRAGATSDQIDQDLQSCYGLTRTSARGKTMIAYGAWGSIQVNQPTLYRGRDGYPYVYAGWSWINDFSDVQDGDHQDGFAIALNVPVSVPSQSLCTWGDVIEQNCGSVATSITNGRGFTYDNYVHGTDGTGKYGQEFLKLSRSAYGCANLVAGASYGHSSSGVHLTGWSVSLSSGGPSITANFSSSSGSWTGYGPDSSTLYDCA